jgi:predicted nucleotidyltransferase
MTCKCGSTRILSVGAKASDCQSWYYEKNGEQVGSKEQDYAPHIQSVASGDYIDMEFCADCGQIQNFEPIAESDLEEYFGIDADTEEGGDPDEWDPE